MGKLGPISLSYIRTRNAKANYEGKHQSEYKLNPLPHNPDF